MTSDFSWRRPELLRQRERGALFHEIRDFRWVNPREFHRRAVSAVEDMGYDVPRGSGESLAIRKEIIGEKTGVVESWLEGEREAVVFGALDWNPWTAHALLLLVGGLTLLMTALIAPLEDARGWLFLVGLGAATGGGLLLRYRRQEEFPVHVTNRIQIYATGEASERTLHRPGGTVTDLFAQLTVTYVGYTTCQVRRSEIWNAAFARILAQRVQNLRGGHAALLATAYDADAAWRVYRSADFPLTDLLPDSRMETAQAIAAALPVEFEKLKAEFNQYRMTIEQPRDGEVARRLTPEPPTNAREQPTDAREQPTDAREV